MAFANIFRQSKFKHVFGKPSKREFCYDNIRVTKSSWDSTFCAVNPRFIAIITDAAGGGAFIVLQQSHFGRVERDPPLVAGHKAAVLDIQWCPHDDELIASASEDCTAKVWQIQEDTFKGGNLTECYRDLVGHNRRVGLVCWHPSVSMMLLTAGADNKVLLWNVEEEEIIKEIDFPDVVLCCSFNWTGSWFVCSCKDKMARVVDARSGKFVAEQQLHEGSKPQQVLFLRDGRILSTGFSRMSERQWAVWQGDTLELLDRQELDSSNGVLFPFYDPDVNLLYLVGKGDSVVRYFELSDESPYVHYLNMYQSSEPQRGMGMMPKRGLDVSNCEIARLYKLHQRGLCEPISFTVPRKSELFQDDLYPDTRAEEAAIGVEKWLEGEDAEPLLVKVEPKDAQQTPTDAGRRRRLERKPRKGKALTSASNGHNESTSASAKSESATSQQQQQPQTSASSTGPELQQLLDDMRKMKIIIKGHERRIKQLEEANGSVVKDAKK